MSGCKKTVITRPNSSYTSLYRNPLTELNRPANGVPLAAHIHLNLGATSADKERVVGKTKNEGKENEHGGSEPILNGSCGEKSKMREDLPKPSFLQLCVKKKEPDSVVRLRNRDCVDSGKQNSLDVWDYSDSEAAPASSWSTLPNRSLLCRPLPLDVGRCTCIIVKESSPDGFDGGTLYTLYTHEGKGRQNRKLAVAHHRRSRGRSEFIIALNARGIMVRSDDSLIGTVTCNIMGSKYLIWDQGHSSETVEKQPKLLAAMKFMATLSTWTGSYRSIRAWIPKHQSMQLRITNQIQHCNGLPTEWEANKDRVHQLFSKAPSYNKYSKKFELDFRDKGRAGLKIQSSVKNFQLTLERNGKQTILQLGRVDKSKYVMDYRYPLTGYQAFSMCLASIDSKLCCSV